LEEKTKKGRKEGGEDESIKQKKEAKLKMRREKPMCNGKYKDPPTEDWIQCSIYE
jgi:hypothetical protein